MTKFSSLMCHKQQAAGNGMPLGPKALRKGHYRIPCFTCTLLALKNSRKEQIQLFSWTGSWPFYHSEHSATCAFCTKVTVFILLLI